MLCSRHTRTPRAWASRAASIRCQCGPQMYCLLGCACAKAQMQQMHATRRARSTDAAQCGCCRLAARTMQGPHRPASAGSSIRRVGVLAPAPLPQRSMDVPVASHGLSPPKAKSGAECYLPPWQVSARHTHAVCGNAMDGATCACSQIPSQMPGSRATTP